MVACRVPIVAAVNGPAVGLGCSLVALSDIVFMAESAHLADPHVLMGLVAADGGPVTWPLMISLQLAKEYALTGDRIPARRAAEIGLVNHVCPDDEVMDQAMACAQRIAKLPRGRWRTPSGSSTCIWSGPSSATLDFALTAEDRSFRRRNCGPTSTAFCPGGRTGLRLGSSPEAVSRDAPSPGIEPFLPVGRWSPEVEIQPIPHDRVAFPQWRTRR